MIVNCKNKLLRYPIVCIFFLLPSSGFIHAQDWLLLKDDNMKGYTLLSQTKTIWPISENSLKVNIIQQRWRLLEEEDFYIDYCEFDSEEQAVAGTAYAANSNAAPFISGSPSVETIGNTSWVSIDGSAIYFQKENIGIKIFKPVNLRKEDLNNIISISNEVLNKIIDNNRSGTEETN